MRTRLGILALMLALLLPGLVWAQAGSNVQVSGSHNDAATGAGHSHTSAATITITPGATQFVYITGIDVSNCAGALAVTAAAPTYITTTNITGSPQIQVGSGVAAGNCQPVDSGSFITPLKSTTAGTAVTFVLPTFATNQTIALNVYYYFAVP